MAKLENAVIANWALVPSRILISKNGFHRIVIGWMLSAIIISAPVILFLVYGKVMFDIFGQGFSELSWEFLIADPKHSGRAGGIFPIVVSTLFVLMIALLAAVPASFAAAVFVAEYLPRKSRLSTLFRASMLVLAGIPSIAFGLFGNVMFNQHLALGNSILSGGLTLAIMITPICAFAFEEVLRLVPDSYRQGAHALGAGKVRIIVFVILPTALPGLISAVLLGIGRALSETAALLFTSGYSDRLPTSVFDPGRVLSVHIFDLAMNIPGGDARAAASAILLMGVFMIISSAALFVSGCHSRKTGVI